MANIAAYDESNLRTYIGVCVSDHCSLDWVINFTVIMLIYYYSYWTIYLSLYMNVGIGDLINREY